MILPLPFCKNCVLFSASTSNEWYSCAMGCWSDVMLALEGGRCAACSGELDSGLVSRGFWNKQTVRKQSQFKHCLVSLIQINR